MALSSAFMAGRMAMTAAGLAQGVIISVALLYFVPELLTLQPLSVTLFSAALIWTLVFQMVWNGNHVGRLFAISTMASCFYGIVCWYVMQGDDAGLRGATFSGAVLLSLFLLLPFLQCWQENGRLKFPYHRLCFYARDNNYLMLIAQIVLGLILAVLYLVAALFDSVGVNFFSQLFFAYEVAPVLSAAALGLGIAIAREKQRWRDVMSHSGIKISHFMLPLITALALALIIALPLRQWQDMLTNLRYPPLLVFVAILVLTAINSVYQDGRHLKFWHGWRKFFAVQLIAVLPIYGVVILLLAIQKYDANGLTAGRYWLFVAGGIITLYGLFYLLACVMQFNKNISLIEPVNKAMALLLAVAIPTIHIPPLDAFNLSARQQAAMVIDGRISVSDFDYGYLYFRLGKAGQNELAEIERHFAGSKDAIIVRREMTFAEKSRNYWDWKFDWNLRKSQPKKNNGE